jgi:hypothetical protein
MTKGKPFGIVFYLSHLCIYTKNFNLFYTTVYKVLFP